MATRTSSGGTERTQPESRRGLESAPYLARTAGLYSEVTWDRTRSSPARPARPATGDAEPLSPPAE